MPKSFTEFKAVDFNQALELTDFKIPMLIFLKTNLEPHEELQRLSLLHNKKLLYLSMTEVHKLYQLPDTETWAYISNFQ